jgi:hypothetical protein
MEHSERAESFINYNFMKGKELVEKTEISHLSQENLCLCITNIITATIKMLPEIKKLVPLPILALIGLVSERSYIDAQYPMTPSCRATRKENHLHRTRRQSDCDIFNHVF